MDSLESKEFKFRLNTNMEFGVGVSRKLPDTLEGWDCKRAGVVVDAGLRSNSEAQNLINALRTRFELVAAEAGGARSTDDAELPAFRDGKLRHRRSGSFDRKLRSQGRHAGLASPFQAGILARFQHAAKGAG